MEGPEIQFAEATIDNGSFGTRTVRFETGRLARQAGGAVTAYLDEDTMLLADHDGRQEPSRGLRLLPPDGRRRGADVCRGQDPRQLLPSRGAPVHGRDPHLPSDRPPVAAVLHQGSAQRGPGRHHGPGAQPGPPVRRPRHQRRIARRPRSPVCRSPARSAASASRSSTATGSPSRTSPTSSARPSTWSWPVGSLDDGRRRHHDGRGRVDRRDLGPREQPGQAGPDRGDRRRGPRGLEDVHQGPLRGAGGPGGQVREAGRGVPHLPRLRGRRVCRGRGGRVRRPRPGARHRGEAGARGPARRDQGGA